MNKLLDANVILRYLLDDIPEQSMIAQNAIESDAFTIPEVICEVVYVLIGVYKVNKNDVRDAILSLLDEVAIANKPIIVQALKTFSDENLDFVDCILLSKSKLLGDSIVSFDKKLNKLL